MLYQGFWVISRVCEQFMHFLCECECYKWIGNISPAFQLNLICFLRETLRFCSFCRFCSFSKGVTVNGVNQVHWLVCVSAHMYVCVNAFLAVQESHRGPHVKEVPSVEASVSLLVAQTLWMVCSFSFVAFPARSHRDHRLDQLANTWCMFCSCSLSFRYWPPLPIVHVLQESVWTVANTNISCNAPQLFMCFCSILYKLWLFWYFNSVEACFPWEYCAHLCNQCANRKNCVVCSIKDVWTENLVIVAFLLATPGRDFSRHAQPVTLYLAMFTFKVFCNKIYLELIH